MQTRTSIIVVLIMGLAVFGCLGSGKPQNATTTQTATNPFPTPTHTAPNASNTTTAPALDNSTSRPAPILIVNDYINAIMNNDPSAMKLIFSPSMLTESTNLTALVKKERLTRGLVSFSEAAMQVLSSNATDAVVVACLGANDEYPSVFTLSDPSGAWQVTQLSLNDQTAASYCFEGRVAVPAGPTDCSNSGVINAYLASYGECDCLYEVAADGVVPASDAAINDCKKTVAARYLDTGGCDALSGQASINDCYQSIALRTGDASYCSSLKALNSSISQDAAQAACNELIGIAQSGGQ